ncbi:hypothetical protein PRK78_006533 [Emydomyces testavorans]|uniref:Aminoglycoside phosphotransferase domain-containing protein n=1 Tax=Emydomyces testavorans TaxID=2070801 RepID=A0AAF0DLK2_9EURO|nr:hypothetical protein PRK78_006533 [Emydomyces testavorans]
MGNVAPTLTLSTAEAAQWNRDLLLRFHVALEIDPAADLLSMFPDAYHHEHQIAQYRQLSYAAKVNLQTLNRLRDTLKGPPDFRTRLELAETATIVFPLSAKVTALLARDSERTLNGGLCDTEKSLLVSLKRLFWNSPKLWSDPVRGVVVRCDEEIVAKVNMGNKDHTEYTSMRYLAEQAPTIPAPRPHGLNAFGPFRVLFMSYIPGRTLTQAWPSMSHNDKSSIQCQLDSIFCRLRTLQQNDGIALGGVCGEGVKELRVDECSLFKGITTAMEFNDLQFSTNPHGSATYVKLLHFFLEQNSSALTHGSVFTHGDVRTDNIMVKQDNISGCYAVTGIIDWEDSGFYPEYYECTALIRTLSLLDEDDCYLYLPQSISPSQFPGRWLVDQLWGIHLRTT